MKFVHLSMMKRITVLWLSWPLWRHNMASTSSWTVPLALHIGIFSDLSRISFETVIDLNYEIIRRCILTMTSPDFPGTSVLFSPSSSSSSSSSSFITNITINVLGVNLFSRTFTTYLTSAFQYKISYINNILDIPSSWICQCRY